MRFVAIPAIAVVALTAAGCDSSSSEATTVAPSATVATTKAVPTAGATTTTAAPTTTTTTTTTLYPSFAPNLVDECPASRGLGDRRPSTKTLTIVQWNLEWLFRGDMVYEGRPYPTVSCPGDCLWDTTAQAQAHLEEVMTYARTLNADIMSVNEVQDCTVMDALSRGIADGHAPYHIWGTDHKTAQQVGMISKIDPERALERMDERIAYPIGGSQCGYTGEPNTRAPMKNYLATFNIEGLSKPLTMIGAHLPSRPTDEERCSMREAEAIVIANRVKTALAKGHHVIVLGDLNDFDRLNPDHDSSMPTSKVLEIIRLDGKMLSATEKLPQDKRFTYDSTKYGKNSLDHFLMDSELYSMINSVEIRHNTDSVTAPSDHLPIIVKFDLNKSSSLIV